MMISSGNRHIEKQFMTFCKLTSITDIVFMALMWNITKGKNVFQIEDENAKV